MKSQFLKTLVGCSLITLLTVYHYFITQLSVFTLVGFTFEFLLVVLFIAGIEVGKSINNKQLNEEEDGEE